MSVTLPHASMNEGPNWLRGVPAEELVFMHNIADAINRLSCRTIESQRATGEMIKELDRRGHLIRHSDDCSNNTRVKRWLIEKQQERKDRRTKLRKV
jgi:hypothetical protein